MFFFILISPVKKNDKSKVSWLALLVKHLFLIKFQAHVCKL